MILRDMKKFLFFIMFFITLTANAASMKEKADSAYAAENYTEAIEIYNDILKEGTSADIYYNLGNSYYKTDEIAKAILNYERAILLRPWDSDIQHNLNLARTKTVDKITPVSEMFFIKWMKDLISFITVDGWAYLALSAFIFALVSFLVYFFSKTLIVRKIGFFSFLFTLVIVVVANIFAMVQLDKIKSKKDAIIMSGSVEVKSTPTQSGTNLFILHSGTKVLIIDDSMKEWKEIKLADGKIGWIPVSDMEII